MNSDWRNGILRQLLDHTGSSVVVADPDSLLAEEKLSAALRDNDCEVVIFEDSISLRWLHETKYRAKSGDGVHKKTIIAVRGSRDELLAVPYDILSQSRRVSFGLGDIFPSLSYPVVASLDLSDLDQLYSAQLVHRPSSASDSSTKDFILRHVFSIAPEVVQKESDLLRLLLRRHSANLQLPDTIQEYLVATLESSGLFSDWPLKSLVVNRELFTSFLQERWPHFLRTVYDDRCPDELLGVLDQPLRLKGPINIPFGHDDVRVYVDNLFLEGDLRPLHLAYIPEKIDKWITTGIVVESGKTEASKERLIRLIELIESQFPPEETSHHTWQQLAKLWGEIASLKAQVTSLSAEEKSRIDDSSVRVDHIFEEWIDTHYAGLHNLPSRPPVMLHHIARSIANDKLTNRSKRVALLVIDGLSCDQWVTIRDYVIGSSNKWSFIESTVFAWLPTITSISRRTIFSGNRPDSAPGDILSTAQEERLWFTFWMNQGIQKRFIAYEKSIDLGSVDELRDHLESSGTEIFGGVINTVDKIMHGMELGSEGMHNQLIVWLRNGGLVNFLSILDQLGFHIWLTSDHGNIESIGEGQIKEGSTADVRGQRARIYSDRGLREAVHREYPNTWVWKPVGLPSDVYPLLARGRSAFVTKGKKTVAHGGASLMELIVPLVQVQRTK